MKPPRMLGKVNCSIPSLEQAKMATSIAAKLSLKPPEIKIVEDFLAAATNYTTNSSIYGPWHYIRQAMRQVDKTGVSIECANLLVEFGYYVALGRADGKVFGGNEWQSAKRSIIPAMLSDNSLEQTLLRIATIYGIMLNSKYVQHDANEAVEKSVARSLRMSLKDAEEHANAVAIYQLSGEVVGTTEEKADEIKEIATRAKYRRHYSHVRLCKAIPDFRDFIVVFMDNMYYEIGHNMQNQFYSGTAPQNIIGGGGMYHVLGKEKDISDNREFLGALAKSMRYFNKNDKKSVARLRKDLDAAHVNAINKFMDDYGLARSADNFME